MQFYPEIFDSESGGVSEHQIRFGKKWKSYSSIVDLAGGDITKFDVVLEEPLEKCLLYLAWKADKNLVDELVHKEMLKKAK